MSSNEAGTFTVLSPLYSGGRVRVRGFLSVLETDAIPRLGGGKMQDPSA